MLRRFVATVLVAVLVWPSGAEAMTDWNPNAATTLGLESFFTDQGDQLIAGGAAAAQTFDSSTSETVDTLSLFLAGSTDEDMSVLVEVFPEGSETDATSDVTTSTFRPTDDLQIGGADSEASTWIEATTSGGLGSVGTTNLYQAIDESTLDVDDWISYNGARAARKRYRFNVGTSGANWPANQRVVGGRLRFVLARDGARGNMEVGYFDGTNTYRLGSVTATPQRRTVSVPFPEYNPATRLPWTRAQIQALSSTAGFQLRTAVGKQKRMRVFQSWLELDWVPESRLAVGRAEVDSSVAPEAGAWVPFTLQVPNSGADNWSKGTANYTVVARRVRGLGSVGWRWLGESAAVAAALGRSGPGEMLPFSAYVPTMEGRGFVSSLGEVVAGRAMSFYLTTTAPASSVDGQPYFAIVSVDNPSTGGYGQLLTVTGTTTMATVRWLGAVTGDITVQIIDQSSSTVVHSQTFTAAALNADAVQIGNARVGNVTIGDDPMTPTSLYQATFTVPPSLPADQYRVVLAGTGTYLISNGLDAASGFGGFTDYHTLTGFLLDQSLTLSTVPATPANFAATADPEASGNEGECGPASIDRIRLTHDATGLGGSFARYEYQRQNPDGTWATIRTETTAATVTQDDWEARLNTVETYRCRQVRTGDLIPSAWTATDTATATRYGHETKIASNHANDGAGAAVAYERGPDYRWRWDRGRETATRQGEGGRWVFVSPDDPGHDTQAELLVYDGPGPTTPGEAMFDNLRALTEADLPHLTVCDGDGGRTYGDVAITEATRTELGGQAIYEATVAIAETQFAPTPVET